jgi:hypothetical protein
MSTEYVPLMLKPDWIWERYYGWSVLQESERLKLLGKRRGPLNTYLVMARGAALREVEAAMASHGLLESLSIIAFNDFCDASERAECVIGGRVFRRVWSRRWLGVGTLVFDLGSDLEMLQAGMASRERTKCRKAERFGVTVQFTRAPEAGPIDAFLGFYARLARERGLERISRAQLEQIFAAGNLMAAHCVDAQGRSLVVNLIYLGHGQGYFLHGARAEVIPDGAGQLIHWETVKCLKDMGLAWYDLGLLASRRADDGIYRFKKALGAGLVDFGSEYRHVPSGLGAAYIVGQAVRRRLRRL